MSRRVSIMILCTLWLLLRPYQNAAQIFIVENTEDPDQSLCDSNLPNCKGSLRWAIMKANLETRSTIKFNIPGSGSHEIYLRSPLPVINKRVLIDGSSQPGYNAATGPVVFIIGKEFIGAYILSIGSDTKELERKGNRSAVIAMGFLSYNNDGIRALKTDSLFLVSNYFKTAVYPGRSGISLKGCRYSEVHKNNLEGSKSGTGISAFQSIATIGSNSIINYSTGIEGMGSIMFIHSNSIGASVFSNTTTSVGIKLTIEKQTLFKITTGNYIFGNDIGILVQSISPSDPSVIQGNFIGITGSTQNFNKTGVKLIDVNNCTIGGTHPDHPNRFYGWTGVNVRKSVNSAEAPNNRIQRNFFYTLNPNSSKQIQLNYGPLEGNIGKDVPTFNAFYSSAGVQFSGTSVHNDRIEIYVISNADQESTYIGSAIANAAGNWSLTLPLTATEPLGARYGATATDVAGNTSEFKFTRSYCTTRTIEPRFDARECNGLAVTFNYSTTGAQTNDRYMLQIRNPGSSTYTTVNTQNYNGSALTYTHTFATYGYYTAKLKISVPPHGVCVFEYERSISVGRQSISELKSLQTCIGNVRFSTVSPESGNYGWTCKKLPELTTIDTEVGTGTVSDFVVNIENPGSYRAELSLFDPVSHCTYYKTKTFTFDPLPGLSVPVIQPASCRNAADGQVTFAESSGRITIRHVSSGTTRMQLNNGVFSNLLPGNYVALRYFSGCTSRAIHFRVPFSAPVVNVCTDPVQCSGTAALTFHIDASRTHPAPSGNYTFNVVDVAANSILASGNGSFGSRSSVSVPGVSPGKQYRVILPAITGTDPTVNHCPVGKTITLVPPTLTLNLNDPGGIYPPCDQNNQRTSVTVSASVNQNTCSSVYSGNFSFQLKKQDNAGNFVNTGSPVVQSAASYTFANVASGNYAAEVSLAPSSLQCSTIIPFIVEPAMSFEAQLFTNHVTCPGRNDGYARLEVMGGIGTIRYQWNKANDPVILSIRPQVTGLTPGSYEVTVRDDNPCAQSSKKFPFTINSAPVLAPPAITVNNCDLTVLMPDNGTGPYTFTWSKTTTDTVTVTTPQGATQEQAVSETVIISIDRNIAASGSTASSHLNTITGQIEIEPGQYQVLVENAAGCQILSPVIDYAIPPFTRTYDIYLRWKTIELEPIPQRVVDNTDQSVKLAATQIQQDLENQAAACINDQIAQATGLFMNLCYTSANLKDTLSLTYNTHQENFTLYYYDRAQNLVRTVPPTGVDLSATNRQPHAFRHTFVTKYEFNSLGQLVKQQTPDGGISKYLYNDLNQLRFSQSSRQRDVNENSANTTRYSYTKYDPLGRVIEVGESHLNNVDFSTALNNRSFLQDQPNYPELDTKEQTYTIYNRHVAGVSDRENGQRFLRNRISYTWTHNQNDDSVYTYYSYDPHGNVEWLIQQVPGLPRNNLTYKYDLLSGNVLQLDYNHGRADQFFHQYDYDEENRLTDVKTSSDGLIWDKDAHYSYYDHGALKSLQLGEDKIQHVDYTYTIQGLLKGINTPDLTYTANENTNKISPDVFGMTLGYYPGDFDRTYDGLVSPFNSTNSTSLYGNPLFNGNISSWTSKTSVNNETDPFNSQLTGQTFIYDKLNRLRNSSFVKYNATPGSEGFPAIQDFSTDYTYDGSGNIQRLRRNGYTGTKGLAMDDLTYSYYANTNRLSKVQDAITTDSYDSDISAGQVNDNYVYDSAGNLAQDKQEGLRFKWNAYGKISEVIPDRNTTSQKPWIKFAYDAAGNRVKKEVNSAPYDNAGHLQRLPQALKSTLYVRDATGNINAVYEKTFAAINFIPSGNHALTSARSYQPPADLNEFASLSFTAPFHFTFPDKVEVTEGNAGNHIVWFEYHKNGEIRNIYFVGGASAAHPSTPEDLASGRFYQHTTDLPLIQSTTGHSASVIDILSAPGSHLEADFIQFHLANGDSNLPNGVGNTGNKTTATLNITELQPDNHWSAKITLKEQPIYGTDRIGQYLPDTTLITYASSVSDLNAVPEQTFTYPGISELRHWFTLFENSTSFNLNNATQSVSEVQMKDALEWNNRVVVKASFPGTVDDAIAVAENTNGQVMLYMVAADKYWGNPNVALLYDRYGYLIPMSNGILADPKSKPVIATLVSGSSNLGYFVFTKGTDGKLYLHIVSETNGNLDNSGVVHYKNLVLDQSGNLSNYGNGLAVIEDRINGRIILFATRYTPPSGADAHGQMELVSFLIEPEHFSQVPVVLATFPSLDPAGNTEIQISPNGRLLALVTFTKQLGWFDQREATLQVLDLNENFATAPTLQTYNLDNGSDPLNISLDFSADNTRIFVNHTSVTPKDQNLSIDLLRSEKIEFRGGKRGAIRRAFTGGTYQAEQGPLPAISKYNTLSPLVWLEDHHEFTDMGWSSGALPLQPHKMLNVRAVDRWYSRTINKKVYELKDHLGNVSAVVSDVKNPDDFTAGVKSYSHYYPFGMMMPDRSLEMGKYRYGFNGLEKDDEMKGLGNNYDFVERIYDPRIARFFSIDPLAAKFPVFAPYIFAANNPIKFIDIYGMGPNDPMNKLQLRGHYSSWGSNQSKFGKVRGEKYHQGYDLYAPVGTAVTSIAKGTIVAIDENHEDFGKVVTVKYTKLKKVDGTELEEAVYVRYAHLNKIDVSLANPEIEEGASIGETGKTGNAQNLNANQTHLHIEFNKVLNPGTGEEGNNQRYDPANFINTDEASQTEQTGNASNWTTANAATDAAVPSNPSTNTTASPIPQENKND